MEKKVKDIMLPIEGYPSVQAGSTVKDAVAVLNRANLRKLGPRTETVVVTDHNKMVGTIGFRELLQVLEPAFKGGTFRGWTVADDWVTPIFMKGLFTAKTSALADHPVETIMRPLQRQLNSEDTLVKAVHVLLKDCQEAIPVWQNDRIVGMVGYADIFNEVAAIQLGQQEAAGTEVRSAI